MSTPTDDVAKDLARRWAAWRTQAAAMAAFKAGGGGPFPTCPEPPVFAAARERLFTWVRERLAREPTSAGHTREDWAGAVADDLDLWDADGECPRAAALIEAAKGWPS